MKAGEGKKQSLLEEGEETESKDMMGIMPNELFRAFSELGFCFGSCCLCLIKVLNNVLSRFVCCFFCSNVWCVVESNLH